MLKNLMRIWKEPHICLTIEAEAWLVCTQVCTPDNTIQRRKETNNDFSEENVAVHQSGKASEHISK